MENYNNVVLQGNENDNTLKAHWNLNDYYTIVHGAGGNDRLSVDPWLYQEHNGYYKGGVELYGDEGNDRLTDGFLSDTLSGGAGDDVIETSRGNDLIDGGEGDDTLLAGGNLSRLTLTSMENLVALGTLRVRALDVDAFESITIGYHSSLHFTEATTFDGHNLVGSRFKLAGSDENDRLDLSATAARVEIDGGDGNDQLLAGSGNASIAGGDGDDEITGGIGKDNLNGSSGNDTIDGGDGNDLIIAEIGNDWVKGGAGNDKISGETIYDHDNYPIRATGDKVFDGGAGNDLFENVHNLTDFHVTLIGGQGEDTLQFHGNASNMSVNGIETLIFTDKVSRPHFDLSQPLKASGDFLESFKHIIDGSYDPSVTTPMIQLTSADDFHWRDAQSKLSGEISATSRADEIDMSKARSYWTVYGGGGDDILTSATGGSELDGGGGDDRIIGGKGGDEISDGMGNDIIDGRGGKDTFYEQDGANTFIFEAGSGTDYLYGFDTTGNGKDKIDLSAVKSISNYSDLIAHHVDEKFGGLYIEFSDKDRVWLDGFSKEILDSSMFIF